MLHDNVAFMRPVAWFLAANRRRATSVDGKFKVEDGFLHTSFVKAVPVALDDGNDRSFDDRIGIGADYKILLELGKVMVTIPTLNISFVAADGKGLRWVTKSFTVLLELENIVIDIVAVVKWNVLIDGFGAPNLGWNVDNKVASGRSGRRQRWNVGIGGGSGRRSGKEWRRKIVGSSRSRENKQREGRSKRERRCIGSGSGSNCALEKTKRQIVSSSSQRGCVRRSSSKSRSSSRRQRKTRSTGMVARGSSWIEQATRWKTEFSSSTSNGKVVIKRPAVHRIGTKRNNSIQIAEQW